ncbi:MAG: hypothetical protein AB2788_21940 [Candidatus Thiodiazotropha endolucinida]
MSVEEIEKMMRDNPLLSFSIYTSGQANYLIALGIDLIKEMRSWKNEVIYDFNNTYYRYWLWVLGAYEIIRTMDENNECFVETMQVPIKELKIYLAKIRIPFAKQEIRGKKQRVYGELSVTGIDQDMFFEIEGQRYSATDAITRFKCMIERIQVTDIIKNYN